MLSLSDFADHVGNAYELDGPDGAVTLVLATALAIPESPRDPGFVLEFSGPSTPILPQAIYAFRRENVQYDIFIVPIGPREGSMRYEAVFN